MSSNIKLKRSAVEAKVPTIGNLSLGELAINTYDGKVFLKKDVGGTESIVTLQEITENNLGIDTSAINNSSSSTLSGVLADFDTAISAKATRDYVQNLINALSADDVFSVFLDAAEERIFATAAVEKSIKFYVQAVNPTTNDIYASEINILYDGTDVHLVEHSIIDTYMDTNGTALVDISGLGPQTTITDASGDTYTTENELALTVTRNANVSDTLIVKYVRNLIDEFPEIGVTDGTSTTTISSMSAAGNNFIHYEVIGLDTSSEELERTNVIVLNDGTDVHFTERNLIHSSNSDLSTYSIQQANGYINLRVTPANSEYRVFRVTRLYKDTIWADTTTSAATQTAIAEEAYGSYRTMFYTVRITDSTATEYQQSQLVVTHDDTDVYITEHSIIHTGTAPLAEFTAAINGSNIELLATPASSNTMRFDVSRKILDA
jgi:hypothetical protein